MGSFVSFINGKIPRGLRMGKFPYSSILYILLFSVFFMLLYMPFSPTTWFSVRTPRLALMTGIFVALAVGTLVISNALFISFCRTRIVRNWHYLLWCMAEIVVISAVYIILTAIFSLGYYKSVTSLIFKTFLCVLIILMVPYSVIYAYFSRRESGSDDEKDNGKPAVEPTKSMKDRMIKFQDDSGVLKFSADIDSVLYIKSDGNYVNIFYEQGDEVVSYALKSPIGALETRLAGTPLVRCQRSYIVNARRVRMMQNDNRALCIVVDNDKVPVIPMSPNYASAVSAALSK